MQENQSVTLVKTKDNKRLGEHVQATVDSLPFWTVLKTPSSGIAAYLQLWCSL